MTTLKQTKKANTTNCICLFFGYNEKSFIFAFGNTKPYTLNIMIKFYNTLSTTTMKTINSLLSFGKATTHTLSVYLSNATRTSTSLTSTSLMRLCAVFMCVLLGYGSTLNAQNINTFAGTGTAGFSGDGGAATSAQITNPFGVAKDASGNIYFCDAGDNRIRKITVLTGNITTICGTGTAGFSGDGGPAATAQINSPFSIAIDASDNIYFSDTGNSRICKITATGFITTICGTGANGFSGDNGAATLAQIDNPSGIAVDAANNVYFCDGFNNRIRKITATGTITTICGTGGGSTYA